MSNQINRYNVRICICISSDCFPSEMLSAGAVTSEYFCSLLEWQIMAETSEKIHCT